MAWETDVVRLYHYERFNPEYLAAMLRNQRIHCSDPTALNDPWDCRPTFDTSSFDDPVERNEAIEFLQSQTPSVPLDPIKEAYMTLLMYNIPSFGPTVTNTLSDTFYITTRERWGI